MRRFLVGIVWAAVAWYLLSFGVGSRVLPFPHSVALRVAELTPQVLWLHAGASLLRVIAALGAASAVAIPTGLLMGRVRRFDRLLAPVVYLLYPVPKIALLPMLLLLLGTGNATRVALLGLVLVFQLLLAVRDGARTVDEHYLVSLDSLGATRRDHLRYCVWPVVLPRVLTAMRIGSATALAVLFFAETFFTRYGLGYFIMNSWMKLAYTDMYAGIVVMSLLGYVLFAAIDRVEQLVGTWQRD